MRKSGTLVRKSIKKTTFRDTSDSWTYEHMWHLNAMTGDPDHLLEPGLTKVTFSLGGIRAFVPGNLRKNPEIRRKVAAESSRLGRTWMIFAFFLDHAAAPNPKKTRRVGILDFTHLNEMGIQPKFGRCGHTTCNANHGHMEEKVDLINRRGLYIGIWPGWGNCT